MLSKHLASGAVMALVCTVALIGCGRSGDEEVATGTTTTADNYVASSTSDTSATTAMPNADGAAKPDVQAEPPPAPQQVLVRRPNYRDYVILRQDGGTISGREFEADMMCKPGLEKLDQVKWALKNVVLRGSEEGMTSFAGAIDGQPAEVTIVLDEKTRAPVYLYVGGDGVATCETSPS